MGKRSRKTTRRPTPHPADQEPAAPAPPPADQSPAPSSSVGADLSTSDLELGQLERTFALEDANAGDPGAAHDQPSQVGTGAAPSAPDVNAEAVARGWAEAVFGVLAIVRGPHWKLQPAETDQLARAFAPLARRVSGYVSPLVMEIAAAAGVTFAVVAPRLALERREPETAA